MNIIDRWMLARNLKGTVTLYYIKFEEFSKIGITSKDIGQRFKGYKQKYTILDQVKLTEEDARFFEKKFLHLVPETFQFAESSEMVSKGGFTECFPHLKSIYKFNDFLKLYPITEARSNEVEKLAKVHKKLIEAMPFIYDL